MADIDAGLLYHLPLGDIETVVFYKRDEVTSRAHMLRREDRGENVDVSHEAFGWLGPSYSTI